MTELRQRMMDAMLVRGLSARTQECYIEAVARMARHYHKSPDLLSPAQVEAYLLHLVKDRQLSYSSVNHAASASRFLFEKVLGRSSDSALRPPMAKVPQKQPELLSREQIARLFACCTPRCTAWPCKPCTPRACASRKSAHCASVTSTVRQTACACAWLAAKGAPTATAC